MTSNRRLLRVFFFPVVTVVTEFNCATDFSNISINCDSGHKIQSLTEILDRSRSARDSGHKILCLLCCSSGTKYNLRLRSWIAVAPLVTADTKYNLLLCCGSGTKFNLRLRCPIPTKLRLLRATQSIPGDNSVHLAQWKHVYAPPSAAKWNSFFLLQNRSLFIIRTFTNNLSMKMKLGLNLQNRSRRLVSLHQLSLSYLITLKYKYGFKPQSI